MITYPRLEPGKYYHVFNRGNNRENIFREPQNYPYFLQKMRRYVFPVASVLAYCLLRNHFHLLIRVRGVEEQRALLSAKGLPVPPGGDGCPLDPSRQFAHLFNGYAKAINKQYRRTGSLFQKRFRRRAVESMNDLRSLVLYIHRNPEKHGLAADFRAYPHSSLREMSEPTVLNVDPAETMTLFNGAAEFLAFHECGEYHMESTPTPLDD
jgi:REP element-mobilizing transposase RayT